jgi:hypothetical protein
MWPPSDPPDIRGKDRDTAVNMMVRWFFANFESTVENMPRDDGDWFYVSGGPYYARDEIESAFSNVASEHRIEEAIAEIEARGFEWAPHTDRIRPEPNE